MTRALSLGLAAALVATAAASSPVYAGDARLLERHYDAGAVFRLEGKANVQTTIKFGDDESIENVAIGNSQKWQVTPNKRANLLFVKPLADRAATNMTVVTDKRAYLFDLVASPAHRNPVYVLSFTYPKEPEDVQRAKADAGPQPEPNPLELAAATDPYAVVDPAALNHSWGRQGDAALMPAKIYDDGQATFLNWPAGQPVPAILVKNPQGAEGPVNFAVRGDLVVVDGVPREIILRSGEKQATLINQAPVGQPKTLAQASTNAPEVK